MPKEPWKRWGEHPGPCLNYEGQQPDDYNGYDSCYLHAQAYEQRVTEACAIVAGLADAKLEVTPWDCGEKGEHVCVFCGGYPDSGASYLGHDQGCTWWRAKAFLEENQ